MSNLLLLYCIEADDVRGRLWSQILTNFIIPEAPKSPPKERKVVIVGLTRLLSQCSLMLQEPRVQSWYVLAPYLPVL